MSRIPVSPEAKPSREAGAMRGVAKARKGGVDAFGETSLQSEAALCQTKRNTLPGEGRERRILLSISINLDKNYFDKINKNKNCVYFGKRQRKKNEGGSDRSAPGCDIISGS